MYFPDVCLNGLWKTRENLSDESKSPPRVLNPVSSEYDAGVVQLYKTVAHFSGICSYISILSNSVLTNIRYNDTERDLHLSIEGLHDSFSLGLQTRHLETPSRIRIPVVTSLNRFL
jgi:hypothetical protein